jgi:hypothetical protein
MAHTMGVFVHKVILPSLYGIVHKKLEYCAV